MFKSIHDEVNTRISKVESQLDLLKKVETDTKLVYTEFKEYMVKPNSLYIDLLTSIPRALGSHEIQEGIMKLSNVYLQAWLEERHPEYKDRIFVSHHNYSTFPSKFRVHFQESEYKNVIHTGQKEICRFDVYEKSFLNALRYKNMDEYEESLQKELNYLEEKLKESKLELDSHIAYQNKPISMIKNFKEFFVYALRKKTIKNNLNEFVEKHTYYYDEDIKKLSEYKNKLDGYRETQFACIKAVAIVDQFFAELDYELVERSNYY